MKSSPVAISLKKKLPCKRSSGCRRTFCGTQLTLICSFHSMIHLFAIRVDNFKPPVHANVVCCRSQHSCRGLLQPPLQRNPRHSRYRTAPINSEVLTCARPAQSLFIVCVVMGFLRIADFTPCSCSLAEMSLYTSLINDFVVLQA